MGSFNSLNTVDKVQIITTCILFAKLDAYSYAQICFIYACHDLVQLCTEGYHKNSMALFVQYMIIHVNI